MSYINTDVLKAFIDAGKYRDPCEKVFSENDIIDMVDKISAAETGCAEVECKDCVWHEEWGEICYKHGYKDRDREIIKCENCKYSIKKDYDVPVSYEYLCILKSTVTHLEEHEATYFCADGKRRDTND